ncbi:RidA family protein [Spirosoma sp. BT702]|uniref:RidA family protein n=1 Tax=Spirosoma profusum TaxID=2771354 RepID=A0A927AV49_9BACT|nr:RidA family protein [Spirosoma profusum]MBD2704966.1 RidA family protein [Spirosoma profusum]
MKFCFILIISTLVGTFAMAQTPSNLSLGYIYRVNSGLPGKQVYISGQRPYNEKGELVGVGNLSRQTEQVFENIKASLGRMGMTMSNVTQVTYNYKGSSGKGLVDQNLTQQVAGIAKTYFAGVTTSQIAKTNSVAKIVQDDILIEIEVIAVK